MILQKVIYIYIHTYRPMKHEMKVELPHIYNSMYKNTRNYITSFTNRSLIHDYLGAPIDRSHDAQSHIIRRF